MSADFIVEIPALYPQDYIPVRRHHKREPVVGDRIPATILGHPED
jgi:hypothetical protein